MKENLTTSMDLFGKALYAYWRGDRVEQMYFIHNGERKPRSMKRYFRPLSKLTKLEKQLASLSRGEILDVGCATGNYVPLLMKYGTVDAIDISEYAIKVAEEKKLTNCRVANIFQIGIDKKYDTITSLENNLGMSGSVERLEKLLKIFGNLLKKNGQILAIQREIDQDTYISNLVIEYKGVKDSFSWMHISSKKIKTICDGLGFKFELLKKGRNGLYLLRITK